MRRQSPGDDEPEKEPPPLIPLPHPLDRLDIKPNLPLPGGLSLPSTEDLNKGWNKIFGPGDKPKDLTCPPGWIKMVDGRCCAGKPGVVDLTKCCAPSQLTILGTCCPDGVDDSRMNCVYRPDRRRSRRGRRSSRLHCRRRLLLRWTCRSISSRTSLQPRLRTRQN